MKKQTLVDFGLFIAIGQLYALLIWSLFDKNYFIGMLIGSVVALKFGYKRKKA